NLVDIPSMLDFHGLLNCFGFGIAVVIAWSLLLPPTNHRDYTFPISKIRGRFSSKNKPARGLVDDMASYVNKEEIPELVNEFYEDTMKFDLKASVRWAA